VVSRTARLEKTFAIPDRLSRWISASGVYFWVPFPIQAPSMIAPAKSARKVKATAHASLTIDNSLVSASTHLGGAGEICAAPAPNAFYYQHNGGRDQDFVARG
jgi:hypothetical protein